MKKNYQFDIGNERKEMDAPRESACERRYFKRKRCCLSSIINFFYMAEKMMYDRRENKQEKENPTASCQR